MTASPDRMTLATQIAGKLCHDFISPASAISQGLDLLRDPSMQDMRDDAISLIEQSSKKLIAVTHYARVAFGAANSSEAFSSTALKELVEGVIAGGRAQLDWRAPEMTLNKIQSRALLNLAYLTVQALPTGGTATISASQADGRLILDGLAEGNRARLKPEAAEGLAGAQLTEGLPGQWIQPFWLWLTVDEAQGRLTVLTEEGRVAMRADLPA